MASIYDWSATAGSNTSVGGVNIAEGMSPALVNDAIRMALAIIRQTFDSSLQTFLNASAQLPIANGGTGVATAAAALTALGGLGVAYQRLPVLNKTAPFNPVDADAGSAYNFVGSSPTTMTINPQTITSITAGAAFVIRNGGTAALSITRGPGTALNKNGAATSADAVLAVAGVSTLIYWGNDVWTITGSGIS